MQVATVLGLTGMLLSGCSSSEVTVDYDPQADFRALRTWNWAPGSSPQKVAEHAYPLTLERLKNAVESELTAKGFSQAPPDRADFLVDVNVLVERRLDIEPGYYRGWYGWGWGYGYPGAYGGGWTSQAFVSDYCILAVNILQSRPPSRVLWSGLIEAPRSRGLSPRDREAKIRREVGEILESFPPRQEGRGL